MLSKMGAYEAFKLEGQGLQVCWNDPAAVLSSSGQRDCADDGQMEMAGETLHPLLYFLIMPSRCILLPAMKLAMVPPTGSHLVYTYPVVPCIIISEESSTRGKSGS